MVQFLNFWGYSSEEVVEHACGMGTLQMGEYVSNVSNGIDTYSVREPLGVCAGICPFNFPAMIPLWVSHFPTFSVYLCFFTEVIFLLEHQSSSPISFLSLLKGQRGQLYIVARNNYSLKVIKLHYTFSFFKKDL